MVYTTMQSRLLMQQSLYAVAWNTLHATMTTLLLTPLDFSFRGVGGGLRLFFSSLPINHAQCAFLFLSPYAGTACVRVLLGSYRVPA